MSWLRTKESQIIENSVVEEESILMSFYSIWSNLNNQDTPQIDLVIFHKNRIGQRLNILEHSKKKMEQLAILIYIYKNFTMLYISFKNGLFLCILRLFLSYMQTFTMFYSISKEGKLYFIFISTIIFLKEKVYLSTVSFIHTKINLRIT